MSDSRWRGGAAFLRQPVNEQDLHAAEFVVEIGFNGRGYTARRREDNFLYTNRNFNPQAHPTRELRILRPVSYYLDEDSQWRSPVFETIPQRQPARELRILRPVSYYMDEDSHLTRPVFEMVPQRQMRPIYGNRVTGFDGYIDAAFRCTWRNLAYIFFGTEYVLLDYAPGTTNDRIVNGPHPIRSIPSLAGTAFAEYGVDAAFGCHDRGGDEAMIFCTNICARINYARGTTNDWIIEGPKTITQMFPFFRGTSFEWGIDAAFESTVTGEAFLFKGSEYALIDYSTPARLIAIRPIRDGFKCFRNTMFERDIGAAFASHVKNQAYLFKGNNYVHFHFTPGRNGDYIIGGPKAIVPANWPSLNAVLPRKNCGL